MVRHCARSLFCVARRWESARSSRETSFLEYPNHVQRVWVRGVIVAYLGLSLILTLAAPQLLLTLVNTAYYGVTQAVVVFATMIFGWKLRPAALAMGVVLGDVLVLWLYLDTHGTVSMWLADKGMNIGAAALVLNVLFVSATRVMWPPVEAVSGLRAENRSAPVPCPAAPTTKADIR